jgi:large subunit ribosomal protein L32
MAEPKKKLSKTRTRRRRADYKITLPKVISCPNCHEPTLPHMACMHCGFYKGKAVKPQLPSKRIMADGKTDDKA